MLLKVKTVGVVYVYPFGLNVQAAFAGMPPVELLIFVHELVAALKFSLIAETFGSTPPLAVNKVAGELIHTVAVAGVTSTADGKGLTCTVTVPLVEHVPSFAVTV